MNRLVEGDLVVVVGVAICPGRGDEVLVAQLVFGPGQAKEAKHAAHGAFCVEDEALVVDGQTTRAHSELLALIEQRSRVSRALLQTLTDVAPIAASYNKTACKIMRIFGCRSPVVIKVRVSEPM